MLDHFFHLDFSPRRSLQEQLRESLVSVILARGFPAQEPLPSCRTLARQLSISRNTVALVYDSLLESGYIVSRPRSGYYLHPDYGPPRGDRQTAEAPHPPQASGGKSGRQAPDWAGRLKLQPGARHGVLRPHDWQQYPYPFVYGQPLAGHFPLERWREVSRNSLRNARDQDWLRDGMDRDDEFLIEQLRTRVLPKRGIWAQPDEILLTLGSQNALYLVARLLMNPDVRVAMENPGFRDALNVFELHGAQVHLQEVDAQGMRVDERLDACDYIYTTPGHQVPTGVSLAAGRREALLHKARSHDRIVLEDDYDAELNFDQHVQPAIKADDRDGRVIYMSSLSKAFSPGLRLGYLVADAELVRELRALRRLMYRHPPLNNQRMLAEFLAQGHYDAHLRRFKEEHWLRRELLLEALARHMPQCRLTASVGAGAFWLEAPGGMDTRKLAWAAARQGILIEAGAQFYFDETPPANRLRLGFHSIARERINPGIARLAQVWEKLREAGL